MCFKKKQEKIMVGTTLEQSKHLLELGLDPYTASLCFNTGPGLDELMIRPYAKETILRKILSVPLVRYKPSWTFDDLWKIMRLTEQDHKNTGFDMITTLRGSLLRFKEKEDIGNDIKTIHWEEEITPLESAYKMVCWLLENKYI